MLAHMAGENTRRPHDAALNGPMAHPRSLCHHEKATGLPVTTSKQRGSKAMSAKINPPHMAGFKESVNYSP
jgi:hypothetical protein